MSITTPSDEVPGQEQARKSVPSRGTRKRVLGDGEGDYCIYEIAPQGGEFPKGSLIPIPEVPRFEDTISAVKWVRNESGDLLAGKQIMIFRACEIMSLQIQTKPTIVIQAKPKVTVTKPQAEQG